MASYLLPINGLNYRILYQKVDNDRSDSTQRNGISKKIGKANKIVPMQAELREDHYSVEKNSNSVFGGLARLAYKYREQNHETD